MQSSSSPQGLTKAAGTLPLPFITDLGLLSTVLHLLSHLLRADGVSGEPDAWGVLIVGDVPKHLVV